MAGEGLHLYSDDAAREAALRVDREVETTPLPGAGQSHYRSDVERQIDLVHAERSNIAKAAGELGLTSDEWTVLRRQLGRSPTAADVKRPE